MPNQNSATNKLTTLLLAATAIPYIIAPLLHSVLSDSVNAQLLFNSLLLIGGSHQVASLYLYIDHDAQKIINKHKSYFYIGPLLIILVCCIFFMLDNIWIENYFWSAFAMLTIFHYQKQNIGVYSLLAPVIGHNRMLPTERFLIMGGALAGMLVFAWPIGRTLFQGTILSPFEQPLKYLSLTLLCLLISFTLFFSTKHYFWKTKEQQQKLRGFLLLGLVMFFLPLFVIEDKLTAFFMFATAHGLQYFVFISFAAINGERMQLSKPSNKAKTTLAKWLNLTLFFILTAFFAYSWKALNSINPPPLLLFTGNEMKKAILGFSISITLIHYWIDSRIWKMRYNDSREFVRSKLYFLF